jgi:hypothetical protein
MLHNITPNLLQALTDSTALAGWNSLVKSAKSATSDLGDAKYMLIALVVLIVLYINLRLARWLSASIKFDPPHHPHKNPSNHQ